MLGILSECIPFYSCAYCSLKFELSFLSQLALQGGDSGELIAEAYRFGVAHPPGYPTFICIYFLWVHAAEALCNTSPAAAANALGVFLTAAAGCLIASITLHLLKSNNSQLVNANGYIKNDLISLRVEALLSGVRRK